MGRLVFVFGCSGAGGPLRCFQMGSRAGVVGGGGGYGPGGGGGTPAAGLWPGCQRNLARLTKLVRSGVPLPLGAVHNQRSLIGLDNLVDLLIRCVDHPAAAGQTLLVSDGEDVSTTDLLRFMAASLGRSARLLPVPVPLLRLAGRALGKQAEIDRLVGSLQIDSRHTRKVLGWTPPVNLGEGIRRMVQGA